MSPLSGARRGRRSLGLLVAGGLLLIATCILWQCFNAPPGSVGLEFPFDLVFYYYPMLEQASERLRQADLPLWNPYQCCGVPFLATAQVAVFYPPTWLILFLPVGSAIKTMLFGQVLASGVFACLFFRALGTRLFAAAIGGVLFIFGCILGQIYWPSQVSTIVWLPLLMWCLERFIQSDAEVRAAGGGRHTGRWGWWALFTLGVTFQALAGFPQFLVYTFYLLVPYAALRLVTIHRAGRRSAKRVFTGAAKKCLPLAAGCLLAGGLAAVQLVPTLELVRHTGRNGDLDRQAVHYLERERGKYFTIRGWLANAFDPRAKMITFDFPDGSGYLGIATPLLVGIGVLLGRRDHRVWFFAVVAVISLLLASGYNDWPSPLYWLYSKLPTGNLFRTPSRLLLLTHFSLITLAVFGLDRMAGGLQELEGKLFLRAAVALMALACLVAAGWTAGDDGVRLAGAIIALLVAAYWVGRRQTLLLAVQAFFVAVLVFDLANATAPFGSLRDIPVEWGRQPHWGGVSPVSPRQLAAVTREAGLDRVALPGLRPTKIIQSPPRCYTVTEYEPLLPQRWSWVNQRMGGEPGFVMCMIDPDRYHAFYDMAGVAYLFRTDISELARARMTPKQWEIHSRVPRRPPQGVYSTLERRATALPRAYLVGSYKLCPAAQALDHLLSADFDWRRSVLLEEDPGFPSRPADRSYQRAEIVSYAPERVVIRTNVDRTSVLVLTDTFFAGWTACVDGTRQRLNRANYLFRAVTVPAGPHEVVFEYRPASFRAGLVITALSAAVFLITAVRARLGRNRFQKHLLPGSPTP